MRRQAAAAAEGEYAASDISQPQPEDPDEEPKLVWPEAEWQLALRRRQRILADAQLAAASADACGPLTASATLKVRPVPIFQGSLDPKP